MKIEASEIGFLIVVLSLIGIAGAAALEIPLLCLICVVGFFIGISFIVLSPFS